jgi:hypothetical protein
VRRTGETKTVSEKDRRNKDNERKGQGKKQGASGTGEANSVRNDTPGKERQ